MQSIPGRRYFVVMNCWLICRQGTRGSTFFRQQLKYKQMDIQKYLSRIDFDKTIDLNRECLSSLQKSHLLNIPFENLDIHQSRKITLDEKGLFNKIILENRGGFCYELNGFFYYLLKEFGFNVRLISGRVYDKKKGYGKEFDHMALIVFLNNTEYLVDVGFGEFVFNPFEILLEVIPIRP